MNPAHTNGVPQTSRCCSSGLTFTAEQELAELRELLERRSGVLFYGAREALFLERLEQHMSEQGLARTADLTRLLRSCASAYEAFLDRLLACHSRFLRLPELYAALAERALPEMRMRKFWQSPRSLRVWSAGCGTGEEPYSLALTIAETLENASAWNIHVLASDISRRALEHAERGVYECAALSALAPERLDTHFSRVGEMYMVKPHLRRMVQFTSANLAEAGYAGHFDIIFCVDVLDYFRSDRREPLLHRFSQCLEPGGFLFLGAGEMEHAAGLRVAPVRHGRGVIYQKLPASAVRRAATLSDIA